MGDDAYSLTSRMYDRFVEPMNAPLRRIAHRVCPPEPGWTVLDVGCGTGAALSEYAAAGCTTIGVDTSPAMIAAARRRLGPDADLRLSQGPGLPVADACADLVVISLVLHSIPRADAVALLRDASRALTADGRVLVTDFGSGGLRFPRGWWNRVVTAIAEMIAGPRHAANALAYLRRGGLEPLVADAGLTVRTHRQSAGGNIVLAVLGAPAAHA
ncbi:class I SAM-dependent methyltransferase [Microbacter sp. GSS18]|nr:class I SAM-dependent methyltransferase [Microbacter sp. GSS18]